MIHVKLNITRKTKQIIFFIYFKINNVNIVKELENIIFFNSETAACFDV